MGETGDLGVLLRNALARVDHDETHVRTLNGELRAHDGKLLDAVVHLGLAADAGGVDEDILAVFVLQARVHGVARCAGHIRDDDAVFAEHEIDERGLADVRLADDGDADEIVLFLAFFLGREVFDAGVEHFVRAVTVDRRKRDRVAETE